MESIRGRRVSAERIVLTAVTRNKLGKHRRDPQISAASSLIVRCAVRHSRGVHSLLSLTFSTIYVLSPIPGPDPCAPPIRFPRTSFVPAGDHCRPIHKNGLTLASHVAARISIRPSDTRSFLLRSSSLVTSLAPLISHPRTTIGCLEHLDAEPRVQRAPNIDDTIV